ncbi:DNA primase [Candidatus Uhrbacteria bacterium]|nr:DNA primase [Candidatus Uhrbacteria bacterium]
MDAVEDIKSRLDIVDAVQEYVPLKPAGSGSFKGICPFHQEKSPSFFANRPRQSWHCFGCNQGGDVISFVMRVEGMDFRETLELLAQKTGVALPSYDPAKQTEKKRLLEVNDLAARWFHANLLQDPRAEPARAYLTTRGVDDLTTDLWRLGFAPESWDGLANAMKEKGVTEEDQVKAGLAVKREQPSTASGSRPPAHGIYDRFRGRLMFPIADAHGRVVGFTARSLAPDAKEAKYVNTPETPVYRKSAVLFGLDKAKGEIKQRDLAILVEGNMDVISSHQFGVTNVVCTSGTALTQDQLALLKRYTNNLAIAFDQDAAGMTATLRGLDLARQMDFNIRIISLPAEAGKDPDEAVRKDVRLWTSAIQGASGIIDWLYARATRGRSLDRPEEKKAVARELLPEFARIADPVERDAWISRLAEDLSVPPDVLRAAMHTSRLDTTSKTPHASPRTTHIPSAERDPIRERSRIDLLEERLRAILTLKPAFRPIAESLIGDGTPFTLNPTPEELDVLAVIADREFEDQSTDVLERELHSTCSALRLAYHAKRRERLERDMRDAERANDREKIAEILSALKELI